MKKVIVLHNHIPLMASLDDLDNNAQTKFVSTSLTDLGYQVIDIEFSASDTKVINSIKKVRPEFVFNLVEPLSTMQDVSYIIAPSLLEINGIKFTGCGSIPSNILMHKLLTKAVLSQNKLLTPKYVSENEHSDFHRKKTYIIKPNWGCASLDLENETIFQFETLRQLLFHLKQKRIAFGKEYFAEDYIDGREFRVSIIGDYATPLILCPIELEFLGFEKTNKHKIYSYEGKWQENSFEFQHTKSILQINKTETVLIKKLKKISIKCWKIFGMRGYGAIDFRIDNLGTPYIIDVNTNPCLTPHPGGIMDAASVSGLNPNDVINSLITTL